MNTLWGRQPVMIIAFVQATLAMLMGFGLHFTAAQMALVSAFVAALLGLLTKTQVTPMATLPDHIAAQITTAANAKVSKISMDVQKPEKESL